MLRVEMLAVGKELLIGRTLNTNALWVGARLARIGTMIKEISTVDDDEDEIASGLKDSLKRSADFVLVVGGLGPTPDDRTLKGVAKALGRMLRTNAEALAMVQERYNSRGLQGIEITPARKKMARLPTGARPVRNDLGTAPAVRLRSGKTTIFALPGVPSEMKRIFQRSVEPEIKNRLGDLHRGYLSFDLRGIFESDLAPIIEGTLVRHPGAYVKSHPKGIKDGVSKIELDIIVVDQDGLRAEATAAQIASEMKEAALGVGARITWRLRDAQRAEA